MLGSQKQAGAHKTRVAWIIGGGSGIGAAVARALARDGWQVAISGRREERLAAVAGETEAIHPYPLDVADTAATVEVCARIVADLGRIDLFLFGAAAWTTEKQSNYAVEAFGKVIDVNLLGLVRAIPPVVAQMKAQGGGQIAGIASVAGYFGLPRSAAYSAGKAAMITLLETMRTELKPAGIDVRMIAPGFVRSELTDANDFPMPFLLETDDAARRIIDGLLQSRRFEIAFPRRMVWLMKAVRALPYPWFFAIMDRLPKGR